ncbi:IS1 family transposase, partial [Klebsiella pneumoniae]|uniref:IS1 family transposase n=1 Tax=Klebsiella pneumoniae TaxID=573 RepID=UPI003D22D41B
MASVSISCPSCSATDGVVRNGKSTAGHQRYLCSHCRKTWQLQFTYTASQPGTHQKIIDMAMNGVGCRATARIMGVMAAAHSAAAMDDACGQEATPTTTHDPALCLAHCSQGDASSDVARVPAVPALPAMAPVALALVSRLEPHRAPLLHALAPPSWHRPTAHPAALLL